VANPRGAPRPVPAGLRTALVGDWRFEHFVLHVFENDGALWARINDPVGERLVYLGDGVFGGTDEPNLRLRITGNGLEIEYYGVVQKARR
jgi:hypothetical protein